MKIEQIPKGSNIKMNYSHKGNLRHSFLGTAVTPLGGGWKHSREIPGAPWLTGLRRPLLKNKYKFKNIIFYITLNTSKPFNGCRI